MTDPIQTPTTPATPATPVTPEAAASSAAAPASPAPELPAGFGLENEHPMLSIPFSLRIGDRVLEGKRLSVTQIETDSGGNTPAAGARDLATLTFPFEDFSITLMVDVTVAPDSGGDTLGFLISNPTGPHLAQLRYIMNSFIAGDIVTLRGMMSYTGPTAPSAPKTGSKRSIRDRVRSIAMAFASLLIVLLAASVVFSRYTTSNELHPVFIERSGASMQATVAGQITYLDPDANAGEVAFSISSTTGDVLSFQKPTDGEVALSSDIYKGATVLPDDLIMTIFDDSSVLRLRTMISIEGLSRALQGDPVSIKMNDGRSLPVKVTLRDTTRTAAMSGDLYVPVDLAVVGEGLEPSDLGKSARLQLSKTLLGVIGIAQEND